MNNGILPIEGITGIKIIASPDLKSDEYIIVSSNLKNRIAASLQLQKDIEVMDNIFKEGKLYGRK